MSHLEDVSLKGKLRVGDTATVHWREPEFTAPRNKFGKLPIVDRVETATITKVGRRYIYATIPGERVHQYEMDTGVDVDNNYGRTRRRMFTPETWTSWLERAKAKARLADKVKRYGWVDDLRTQDLQALAAILDPEGEPEVSEAANLDLSRAVLSEESKALATTALKVRRNTLAGAAELLRDAGLPSVAKVADSVAASYQAEIRHRDTLAADRMAKIKEYRDGQR